jgi:hypothetical protein
MPKLARFWPTLALAAIVGVVVAQDSSFATCTGSDPCNACKNCKYCKHCAKDGGTCGVRRLRAKLASESMKQK